VADDAQYFFIAVTTSAPTAAVGTASGGFLGMFVTHPGLALTGQTSLAVNVGLDENFFRQASNQPAATAAPATPAGIHRPRPCSAVPTASAAHRHGALRRRTGFACPRARGSA
jgi:hypothetical protein